jgi:uncharacterized NAD(P)/FAD-binding protein YdhS
MTNGGSTTELDRGLPPPVAPAPRPIGRARPPERIVIVGGGYAGALMAVNLVRHGAGVVTLVERTDRVARGVAYSATRQDLLLNVRAGNMSALPDQPAHLLRWLDRHHPGRRSDFIPRAVYGDYLAALLAQQNAQAGGRIAIRRGEAVDLRRTARGTDVILADGDMLPADSVILAPGNLPPAPLPALSGIAHDPRLYRGDPWQQTLSGGLAADEAVLLVGTGLTAVDAALMLDAEGFRGPIVALSRRGLLPLTHGAQAVPIPALGTRPPTRASALLRAMRRQARTIGWRAAVDQLRPLTQILWSAASVEERARFLHHLRPWWDIHRHRIAPEIGARIAALRANGRLSVQAGRLIAAEPQDGGALVSWRPRGDRHSVAQRFGRVINCTGPAADLRHIDDPLLANLLARGLIRPDAHHIGIDANAQSEVIGVDGRPNPDLLVIGPMTRGAFWEIVAVPDIRVQSWSIARRLTHSHWVEGDGL